MFPIFLRENLLRKEFYELQIPDNKYPIDFQQFLGGWGNGYVGLPKWHPFFGRHYDTLPVRVHGGITYSQYNEELKLWIIGFDTNHSGDNKEIQNFEYVKSEAENLLDQCVNNKDTQRLLKLYKIKRGMV